MTPGYLRSAHDFLGGCARSKSVQIAIALTASTVAVWQGYKWYSGHCRRQKLWAAIRKRQAERNEVIEKLKRALNSAPVDTVGKRQRIVNTPVKTILEQLQKEELTAVEVLEAFQMSALQAHQKTNCVAQFILEARDFAVMLDNRFKGKAKPPLFGLPFSVKESCGVKGYDATAGYAQHLHNPMIEDSALVATFRQQGAIPFVLTNVPQTLLSFGCSNLIYGVTTNPYSAERTCGGSSGGEGALLALHGSAFGIGSDLAGSIRIPCHYCGIAGIKPSTARVSQMGVRKSYTGRAVVLGSVGPMAPDVETLVLVTQHLLGQTLFDKDMYVVPMPFQHDLYAPDKTNRLTIGYYDYDGFMPVTPACKRAMDMAKEALQKAGHKLVPMEVPEMEKAVMLFLKTPMTAGLSPLADLISNDLPDLSVKDVFKYPAFWRLLLGKLASFYGLHKIATAVDPFSTTTAELRLTYAAVAEYKTAFGQQWRRLSLDAVVCPVNPAVAMPSECLEKMLLAFSYTFLYSLLDFCAGVVPVTKVTPADEQAMNDYEGAEFFSRALNEISSNGTVGLPVGVQCAAPPCCEEVCLRVMKIIEDGQK